MSSIQLQLIEFKSSRFPRSLNHAVSWLYHKLGKLEYAHVALVIHDTDYDWGWAIENTWGGTYYHPYYTLSDLSFPPHHTQIRVSDITNYDKGRVYLLRDTLYADDIDKLLPLPSFHQTISMRLAIPEWVRGSVVASARYWRGLEMRSRRDYICTDIVQWLLFGPDSVSHLSPQLLRLYLCGPSPLQFSLNLDQLTPLL